MRSGDFSATIVVNGVEQAGQADGVVPVAFGDQYAIRLRTHSGRRAAAHVWIDDVEVTGNGIIVPSYGYLDLETPPASPGSRFRFASAYSPAADAAGKAGPDADGSKGLIRVEFRHERALPSFQRQHLYQPSSYRGFEGYRVDRQHAQYEPAVLGAACKSFDSVGAESYTLGFLPDEQPVHPRGGVGLQDGVTVAGDASLQQFHQVHFETDGLSPVVISLKLRGYTRAEPSYHAAPVSRSTSYCAGCGRQADVLSNICECGRRLR